MEFSAPIVPNFIQIGRQTGIRSQLIHRFRSPRTAQKLWRKRQTDRQTFTHIYRALSVYWEVGTWVTGEIREFLTTIKSLWRDIRSVNSVTS